MDFKEELKQVFGNYNIVVNDQQIVLFDKYYQLILEWNEKFNLTSILQQRDVIIKHFLDSCLVCESLKDNTTLIDVGAGAGFPSIPIKILRPDIDITMINADFVVFAGHKTLYSPFGVGGFVDNSKSKLNVSIAGGTGSDSLNLHMPKEEPLRFEPASNNSFHAG